MEEKEEYYVTIFSRKLYIILKKHNIFPFSVEPNRKFPQYQVYKYHNSQEIQNILQKYRTGEFNDGN